MSNIITGKVVKVLDECHIVINRGSADQVTKRCRFLVYSLGEELQDPETGESLGRLEIVCGEGVVDHIQERMTTLKTARREPASGARKIIRKKSLSRGLSGLYSLSQMFPPEEIEEISNPEMVDVPFEGVEPGCLVRQIE